MRANKIIKQARKRVAVLGKLNKPRTARDLFNTLPEPFRSQAIKTVE